MKGARSKEVRGQRRARDETKFKFRFSNLLVILEIEQFTVRGL